MAQEIRVRHTQFRYADAGDLENGPVDFDGLDVRNANGDKVGDVEGFIVDAETERPYYVVVDSGGWFSGGRYLVPVNHVSFDRDEQCMRVDLDKNTIQQYPKFDKDEFERMSDAELKNFEERIGRTCCPDEATARGTAWTHDEWRHYQAPAWWSSPRDRVPAAREQAEPAPWTTAATPAPPREQERIVAREGQPVGDRAQPGDVLGIESGGAETHLGETPEEMERRARTADREARKAEKNERG